MDPAADPSDPEPLPISPDDLRSSMRMFRKSEIAIAVLLAAGIAALLTLTPHRDNLSERQASVPACDGDLCGETVALAPPETRVPQTSIPQTSIPQTSIAVTSIPETSIAVTSVPLIRIFPETPNIGRTQNEDGDRQPALDAAVHREPAPDAEKHRPPPALSGKSNIPGIVTSRKTGTRARVGVAYAARFQAYIDDLENNHGARIIFMGGIRPGHCASSSMHPCGKALDVCQLRRGVVDSRCHLPPRQTLAQIAASHGLFEGGRWCNSDYGHAQLGVTAPDCGERRTRIVQRHPDAGRRAAFISYE